MARKKGGGGRGRQRAQQRAQYDELDKYPVMPPHAFARIVRDKRTLNIIYQIIEPPMTKKEQEQREEIMDIFIRSLTCQHRRDRWQSRGLPPYCDGQGHQIVRNEDHQEVEVQTVLLHST
jgi:hypothetical protein